MTMDFGNFVQVKGLIGRYAQFVPGKRGMWIGTSADGNQNLIRTYPAAVCDQPDRMRIFQHCTAVEHLGAGVLKTAPVEPLKTFDFTVLVFQQNVPVERSRPNSPTKSPAIFKMLGKLRGIDEKLLRNAAANDARSAIAVFLGDRDFLTETRRQSCRPDATGTGADDE